MFADNLHRYLFEEDNRRRRDDRISLVLSLGFSAMMLACGSATKTAALAGLAFLLTCVTFSTTYYCLSFKRPIKAPRFRARREAGVLYRPVTRRTALIAVSAAAVVTATVTEVPDVGATVVDHRLRTLAAAVPLDQKSMDGVAAAIEEATKYKLKLRPARLKAVASALEETSRLNPALSPKATKVGTAVASASTLNIQAPRDMKGKAFASLPKAEGSRWEFFAIAANNGPDNYETIGVAASPDTAEMWHMDEPPPPAEYGPAYLVVKGLTATLDDFYLKHVLFQDMFLVYHGGPLILDEVYFVNCSFQIDPTAASWPFISAVIKGGWVSFSHVQRE